MCDIYPEILSIVVKALYASHKPVLSDQPMQVTKHMTYTKAGAVSFFMLDPYAWLTCFSFLRMHRYVDLKS